MNLQCQKLVNEFKKDICQQEIDFPELLRFFRETEGVSRKSVCTTTGLTESRLFSLETGAFVWPPKRHELELLAKRYGVKYIDLIRSYEKYAEGKRELA